MISMVVMEMVSDQMCNHRLYNILTIMMITKQLVTIAIQKV